MQSNYALEIIVNKTIKSIEQIKRSLETEPSAAKISRLQGELAGNKILIRLLTHWLAITTEDLAKLGAKSFPDKIEALDVARLQWEWEELRQDEGWQNLSREIDQNKAQSEEYLLFDAINGRDLHVTQGRFAGQSWYLAFFDQVAAAAALLKMAPVLEFDR
jgi:hypothetical protein